MLFCKQVKHVYRLRVKQLPGLTNRYLPEERLHGKNIKIQMDEMVVHVYLF